ncbi:MAG: cobalt-precorrin-5B (C(1))-methyltransferase CbiD [Clostridiales bacterium]|nr:cobalt-precorrin-5B (C(1))-methyltransferase CbiD [Clostridiales bacterium]
MNEYIVKSGKKLRLGFTTGSCAAAAAKAGVMMLLQNQKISNVKLTLPGGKELLLDIEDAMIQKDSVSCCVVKDGGDDPDVTNGLKIYAKVIKDKEGIKIDGGTGVGRVEKPGLPCRTGDAAINPVPKKMIENAVSEAAALYGYKEGFHIEISVPGGEKIAPKTFNPRLGIIGGISILGTTGIVEPMSEEALIQTIKLEIDSKKRSGDKILFVSPGNYGLHFAEESLDLDIDMAVKCSNYIGETLDYALYSGFYKLFIVGHVGKLVKIAAGVMNTHSKTADCRNEIFAAHAAMCGADSNIVKMIMESNTTDQIHSILEYRNMSNMVYNSILEKIVYHLHYRTMNKIQIGLVVFSNENGILMQTGNAEKLILELKEKKS